MQIIINIFYRKKKLVLKRTTENAFIIIYEIHVVSLQSFEIKFYHSKLISSE